MQSSELILRALKKDFLSIEEGCYLYHNVPTSELMCVADQLKGINT